MNEVGLDMPLTEIHGIGQNFITKLKRLDIITVKNLLWHFPARYEDFTQIYKIADLTPNQEATVQGIIKKISGRRTWRRRLYLVEASITDESGSIRAIWFNQPYIKNILQPGKLANFSGKVLISDEEELYLSNPTYELIPQTQTYPDQTQINADKNLSRLTSISTSLHDWKHTGRIIPIYPETKGLTSKGFRYLIKPLLNALQQLSEIIPLEILEKENLPEINKALRDIHFPTNINATILAKKRFAFEDLFLFQLYNLMERLKLAQKKAVAIKINIEEIKKMITTLPFELTPSQKKSLWEILKDLEKSQPMNRLLQGDVGSGKTIVAAIAAIQTAKNGYQTTFMAPTEILARQHYNTFIKFFSNFFIHRGSALGKEKSIALLTSNESKVFYDQDLEANIKKSFLKKEIAEGKIKIIIGTHALIQKSVKFHNLALVIVDEQHRFGVKQRAELVRKQTQTTHKPTQTILLHRQSTSSPHKSEFIPHFLSMSATPIPRTLSLTIFGDLDLSLITELPKNRKPIITKVVAPENREKAYVFIKNQIKKGRQVFVICPRIEPQTNINNTENGTNKFPHKSTFNLRKSALLLETKAVKEEYEKLSKKIFPNLRIGMLHGKMKPKEKEKIMHEFTRGNIDILVSTSVVEVGVDVPNATIMIIEGAERFGLAQLYQFRGRVGRGEHQSFCFLFTDSTAKTVYQRLKSIVEAKNGLELAEKDLQIRGPGEFLGTTQTGMPDLAMKALQNPELVKTARQAAYTLLQKDLFLKNYPLLRERLIQFKKEIHLE